MPSIMELAAGGEPRGPPRVRSEDQQPQEECCSEAGERSLLPGSVVAMVSVPAALGTATAQTLRRRTREA